MIGFGVALVFSNAFEWYAHKYVLHGTRKQPGQPRHSPVPILMTTHWTHHKEVRLHEYHDDMYTTPLFAEGSRALVEVKSLLRLCAATTLVAPIAPFFTLGTYYCAANYYYVHRRSHMQPEWGKKRIPWHFDHHMNTNQDANWCVTRPWFDYVMGTRVISDVEVAESNPLGIKLPAIVEKPLNSALRKIWPKAFARLEENRREEETARHDEKAA